MFLIDPGWRIAASVKVERQEVLPARRGAKRNKKIGQSRIVLTNKSLSRTVSEAPWTGPRRLRDRWVSLGHGVLRHGESFAGPRGAAAWRQRYATRERGNPRAQDDAKTMNRWDAAGWLVLPTHYFRVVDAFSIDVSTVIRTCLKVGWRDERVSTIGQF